ncbi:MAG: 3-hydroxyacyl-CoA dehydrogenase NAD-binding domain-containing protein [Nocardioides sp.]|uniref:3-hydroxyacyl-CoA dehydrogenase NAD-binding domain-containing protein n=1 Tax=Nocardioides sp. TaxID=35761 RepID=UPI0039E58620
MNDATSAVRLERDADGIATLVLDDPHGSANTMNDLWVTSMKDAVDELAAQLDDIVGVVVTSAKKTFFAGGDLKKMSRATRADAATVFAETEGVKATLRRLETLGRPVVAAINGAALGGGLEIALACHHRIAADARYDIGLPEVTLGLLPGGGGVTRTVRMFGIMTALMDILGQGTRFKPAAALEKGLVDELVAPEALLETAKAWIRANADDPEAATQPWDRAGYRLPGGTPSSPKLAAFLPAFAPILRKQLKQADMRAPKAILEAAVEGAQVDFETATRIESRYFVDLVTGQQSKNMTQAFFFDLGAINAGTLRPDGHERYAATKVGVLGAGMMGAGIAYACARAGMDVVLKDVAAENAERGKAYTAGLNEKGVARGKISQQKADEILGRITPTADPADLSGCDLVIEAVFEDVALKQGVFAEIASHVAPDALLCSNTSTLPITELAKGIDRPADFIGLHFFSPVDKMPLVEIIRGAETSDEALAKAYDVVQQIKKTPIVVHDSRGFYTSRVIGTRIEEGLAMLAEGLAPYTLERAATQAGYPVGPLQLADELNLELMVKIASTTRAAAGVVEPTVTERVCGAMIEAGRPSKLKGAGFYSYAQGRRGSIWPGLGDLFPVSAEQIPLADARERMLFREAIETARCFEEGVLTSAAHANIGSIFGIGFPPATGGAAQFMTGYEAADGSIGLAAFLARADELADAYGEQLRPTAYLRELAARGEGFPA